jgi:DNA polymerase-1
MGNKKSRVLAVDGNSILNRAYYGIRMLTTADGLCTNAVYGMITMLKKQLDAIEPDHCVIAFDLKAPTFRHNMYDGYKANRKGMPEELAMQLPYAHECAEAMGFRVIEKEGFEADDILGTVSKFASDDCEVFIFTGDRDSLQLIDENVKVLLAGNVDTIVYDCVKFEEKYGVRVDQFVDVKALMGDSSDNIPGVAGIGEKTAIKLISDFGTLDKLYETFADSSLTAGIKNKLESGKENAFLSRTLAKINCEVDLGVELDDIASNGIDKKSMLELCKKLEFSALIKKLELDTPEEKEMLDSAVEIENVDSETINSQKGICAFSYNGESIYVVNEIEPCKVLVCNEAIGKMTEFLEGENVKTVCYDSKHLYKSLEINGIHIDNFGFDVMLGAYVLDPAGNFDLSRLVARYMNEVFSEDIPEAYYAMAIYKEIAPIVEEREQHGLLFDIEMPLARVLADMEMAGFRVDIEGLKNYGDQLGKLEKEAEERIYCYAGEEFNVNSPKQLGEVLFEKLMLPSPGKKTKTGYSTNAEVLEKMRPYHPIIEEILEYRKVAKLKSTYADGLVKAADGDGRVRTNFKQTGTATGRLSSTEPNLQNIPIRTELGRELRRYFLPENEDYVLLDADYSQIELRLLADISKDENMISAFLGGEDIHTSTAAAVFGVPKNAVTGEQRKRAKAVNFGIVYGIGAFSLASDLGISRAKANEYIENYLSSYPGVRDYLKNVVKDAYANGYVTTPLGRRRYIPELAGQNKNLKNFGERVAMNSPIQGSAADIIKIAMVNVSRKLKETGLDARLILQVHDELLIEARRDDCDKVAEILQGEMEHAVSLAVPLVAEVTVGENWFDNK